MLITSALIAWGLSDIAGLGQYPLILLVVWIFMTNRKEQNKQTDKYIAVVEKTTAALTTSNDVLKEATHVMEECHKGSKKDV